MSTHVIKKSGSLAACAVFAVVFWQSVALAMTPVAPIKVDGGPLGELQLSGAADGYFYAIAGAGSKTSEGQLRSDKSVGAEFFNGQIKVVKPTGLVQFTVDFHPNNSLILGKAPAPANVGRFSLGPIYAAFLTLQPTPYLKISAGQLYTAEGMESSMDWLNSNIFQSTLYTQQNSSSRGISVSYTQGKFTSTLIFGDGYDTGIWNYLQSNAKYFFNKYSLVGGYFGTNLSHTPLTANDYGLPTEYYPACKVSCYGTNYVNDTIFGGYYSWGNKVVSIEPEIQYAYAKRDEQVAILGFSSNFSAAVFSDYRFIGTPWSIGSFVEGFTNNGPENWGLGARAQGFGLSVTPTWQHNMLFARGDVGWLHLTKLGTAANGTKSLDGYGSSQLSPNVAEFILEGGVIF
jgi:hypothetical protein